MSGTTLAVTTNNVSPPELDLYNALDGTWNLSNQQSFSTSISFGASMAMSGTTLLVGAPTDSPNQVSGAGAALAYTLSTGQLIPMGPGVSDPTYSQNQSWLGNEYLGITVSISGNNAVVGEYGATVNGLTDSGTVLFFTLSGGNWVLNGQPVYDPNNAAFDQFGSSVAISGDNAVIGSMGVPISQSALSSGEVYFFSDVLGGWVETAFFSDPAAAGNDEFGYEVSISGTNAVVGAPGTQLLGASYPSGAAYFYSLDSGFWAQSGVASEFNETGADAFGSAVAISGTSAAVGAPYWSGCTGGVECGQVIFYSDDSGTWTHNTVIADPSQVSGDNFGESLGISGTRALVGSPMVNGSGLGAVYFASLTNGAWTLDPSGPISEPALTSPFVTPSAGDWFGLSVAIDGTTALVSAPDAGQAAGVVYAYTYGANGWTYNNSATFPLDLADGGLFGIGLALDGTNALVGAPYFTYGAATPPATQSGIAYFYSLTAIPITETVSNTSLYMAVGNTYPLVTYSNDTGATISYAVSSGSTFCSVSASGTVSATAGGTCSITVTATPGPSGYWGGTATTVVAVFTHEPLTVTVQSTANALLTSTPSLTRTSNDPGATYTYTVTQGSCVVSSSGVVSFSAAGTCAVEVDASASTAGFSGTASGTETFTVTQAVTVTIPHSSASVTTGTSQTITPTSNDSSATFSFSFSAGATNCALNSQTGVVTFSVSGSCTVTVTATPNSASYSGTATTSEVFTITTPSSSSSTLLTFPITASVTTTAATGIVGGTSPVLATANDVSAHFTYAVTSGAASCSVAPSGVVTFTGAGVCTVTATATAMTAPYSGTASASETFTVSAPAVTPVTPVATATLTFSAGAGSGSVPAAQTVTATSQAVLPQSTGLSGPRGQVFRGWSIGGVLYAAGGTVTVTTNETATAEWASVTHSVPTVTLHFALGVATLSSAQEAQLRAWTALVKRAGMSRVVVLGSASAIGSPTLNVHLAAARAKAAATYVSVLLQGSGIFVSTSSRIGTTSRASQYVVLRLS